MMNVGDENLQGKTIIYVALVSEVAKLSRQSSSVEFTDVEKKGDHYRREVWVGSKVFCQLVLSSYLGIKPTEVCFVRGNFGKPSILGFPLHFNLSHSEKYVALAVSLSEVGVDIESVQPISDLDDLIKATASNEELSAMDLAPIDERLRLFFRMWVCKEAVLKLKGVGLMVDPRFVLLTAPADISEVPRPCMSQLDFQLRFWWLDKYTPLALASHDANALIIPWLGCKI